MEHAPSSGSCVSPFPTSVFHQNSWSYLWKYAEEKRTPRSIHFFFSCVCVSIQASKLAAGAGLELDDQLQPVCGWSQGASWALQQTCDTTRNEPLCWPKLCPHTVWAASMGFAHWRPGKSLTKAWHVNAQISYIIRTQNSGLDAHNSNQLTPTAHLAFGSKLSSTLIKSGRPLWAVPAFHKSNPGSLQT